MISPVYNIKRVPIEKIQANTYNPNHVAPPEMKLLYDSIKEDGYTMPIVCYYLPDVDKYEIVDGYHRYTTMLLHKDIYEREGGCLPVSVIDKPLSDRMASTVRHNRARGSHDVDLMTNIVAELKECGMSDAWILKHLEYVELFVSFPVGKDNHNMIQEAYATHESEGLLDEADLIGMSEGTVIYTYEDIFFGRVR